LLRNGASGWCGFFLASDIALRKSTGLATLDQACIEAIQNAQFVPATVHGSAI
jgi:hypothetical protein